RAHAGLELGLARVGDERGLALEHVDELVLLAVAVEERGLDSGRQTREVDAEVLEPEEIAEWVLDVVGDARGELGRVSGGLRARGRVGRDDGGRAGLRRHGLELTAPVIRSVAPRETAMISAVEAIQRLQEGNIRFQMNVRDSE